MLNLLTSAQLREADEVTIAAKYLSSENLMEVAAQAFVSHFTKDFPDREEKLSIYCGTGNNGGDGLAAGRLLAQAGYRHVAIKIARFNTKVSRDFAINLERAELTGLSISDVDPSKPALEDAGIIIDALLGSGLNRPLTSDWKKLVRSINALKKTVVSVDVPAGFITEGAISGGATVLKAKQVITFQLPKINFFFPEAAAALDRFSVLDIGLDNAFISRQRIHFKLVEQRDVMQILQPRKEFSHKGTYGHTLIVAGGTQTMGAAILCAGASVYTGSGLTTAAIPADGFSAMNAVYPEVMLAPIAESDTLKGAGGMFQADIERYNAIVIGPGLGTGARQLNLLKQLLEKKVKGMVLDADALNMIAVNPDLLPLLPAETVITPHMKEFDRLFGDHRNWWSRVETARKKAALHKIIIVLKNRYTFIIDPRKQVFINPTGSPAMASGGMGDVLAGMIGALIGQGYSAEKAALASVYIHGLCGEQFKKHVVSGSDVIKMVPEVLHSLTSK